MVVPDAPLPIFMTIAATVVGLMLLVVPLIIHFRNQHQPKFTFLRRQLLLSISAVGMIVLAIVLVTATIPDFWSDTDRFDSKQEKSPH